MSLSLITSLLVLVSVVLIVGNSLRRFALLTLPDSSAAHLMWTGVAVLSTYCIQRFLRSVHFTVASMTSPFNSRLYAGIAIGVALSSVTGVAQAQHAVFPGSDWDVAPPASQFVDSAKLGQALAYLESITPSDGWGTRSLAVVRNGFLIWQGSEVDRMHDNVYSVTKSFTSTALGLLVDDGLASLDTRAMDVVPDMASVYPDVTLRHFATMTSGYHALNEDLAGWWSTTPFIPDEPAYFPPGAEYLYSNTAMEQFANVLTQIAEEPLVDLFRRHIADPIGMDPDKWSWPVRGVVEGPPVNYGSINIKLSASEAARFGHLFLNRGQWGGEQLISAEWVDQATSVQVPASLPAYPDGYDPSGEGPGIYGYNWWVNGIGPNGSRLLPGATPGTYAAWGHGNNLIFVIPEWDMVVVRLATGEAPITPEATYLTGLDWGPFLSRIGSALVPDSGALSVQMPAMQLYTVIDDDSDGTIGGSGDTAQDVADLPRRPVGEIDDATANRLVRLGTKFHLPNVSNPAERLTSATLRFFLEEVVGDPVGAVSLFHSTGENDLDLLASDYEDPGYEDTLLDLVDHTDEPGKYYELDVTDLVLADYAADGSLARSAFRLQINEAEFMDDDQGSRYVFTMPGAEGNHPELVLTFVPEPSSLISATLGIAVIVISRRGFRNLSPSERTCSRRRHFQFLAALSSFVALAVTQSAISAPFSLLEATVADINRAFDRGVLTSERLVELYLNRIAAYDDAGPALNTMITLNPAALETARALDEERRISGPRSALHGVPIVLKDLHDAFGMPTTSGALALRNSYPPDDAFIVHKLREAGAVILGKTNLDEFGCCSVTLSSLGGQTRNAYDPTRVPGGSSGGTAAAIAANFAVIGTGSDWWDSIQVPATLNAVVGLMPTRALISGDGAMPPPSERRGVTGPIARTVADAAAMLDVIAGVDPNDPVTASSAGRIPDSYLDSLDTNGLHGARIGLVVNYLPLSGPVRTLVDAAVVDMQSQGAEILSVRMPEISFEDSFYNDFEYSVNRYLDSLGPEGRFDNLRELLASGEVLSHDTRGFNGDIRPEDDPKYAPIVAARDMFEASVLGLMDDNHLDALIYPPLLSPPPPIATAARVWESSSVLRNTNPSPFLGFPSITLPMGVAQFEPTTTPMGIQFLGRPFSEQTLIKLAYAYEQSTQHRLPPGSTPPLLGEPSAPMRVLVRDVYTIVDDDSDGMIDGMGDAAQDVADLARRPVGEIDDPTANRLVRLVAKFQLPGLIDPQGALRNATLRFFLENIVADPAGPVSLYHSVDDNDLDLLASDYEDPGYEDTLLDLVGPTDMPGRYYEVDVTDLVLADYAADGAFSRSVFRLQINEAEFMDDDQGARYVFTMPGAEGNHPDLVLTFVPEPGTLLLAVLGCLGSVCFARRRPRHGHAPF